MVRPHPGQAGAAATGVGNGRISFVQWLVYTVALLAILITPATSAGADTYPTYHIIAHSHCDPGWLNTFEGYYMQEVKSILDSVLMALVKTPTRKFVWSESSFFARWWETLSLAQRQSFRQVLQRGQFEFVNGGWSQHDEACPDPLSMINQMTEGHQYLLHEFGLVPRVAWQIDPFGHSSVTPTLFRMMGFQALVINRIHHQIKDYFKEIKHMEFLWRGDEAGYTGANSNETEMLTHVLHTHYSAPQGYDWEEHAPQIDDRTVAGRARQLVQMLQQRATAYRHRHLLVPFGDDFKFKNAELQFSQMGQLIEHINSRADEYGCRIQFSTLSDYFSAVSNEGKFPTLQGDFFPYADNEQSYWTGYYTTRPLLKEKSRTLGALLRSAEILHSLLRIHPGSMLDTGGQLLPSDYWERQYLALVAARQDTALFLHHDAITGTARSNVVTDYIDRMTRGAIKISQMMADMLQHALTKDGHRAPLLTSHPHIIDIGDTQQTHNTDTVEITAKFAPVIIFNSLAWQRKELVSIQISSRHAALIDSQGQIVPCQIDATFTDNAINNNVFTIHFVVTLPPLGAQTFFISLAMSENSLLTDRSLTHHSVTQLYSKGNRMASSKDSVQSKYIKYQDVTGAEIAIRSGKYVATFDSNTGLLQSLSSTANDSASLTVSQSFQFYRTSQSGAYLFRPEHQSTQLFSDSLGENGVIRVVQGPIVSRVTLQHHRFAVSYTLVNDNANSANDDLSSMLSMSFESSAEGNQEIVLVTETNLVNRDLFYTHNGWQFTRRKKGPGPLASQFYPMVAAMRVQDERDDDSDGSGNRLTIITSRTMAASVPAPGRIEMLVHRRLNQDDGRGLAEGVNDDSKPVTTLHFHLTAYNTRDDLLTSSSKVFFLDEESFNRHLLLVQHPINTFYLERRVSEMIDEESDPYSQYLPLLSSVAEWDRTQHKGFSPLAKPLPTNLHLHSMMARDAVSDNIAIRLQHIGNENSADASDSKITVDIKDYFSDDYYVAELRRVSLTLNHRLPWNGIQSSHSHSNAGSDASNTVVNNAGNDRDSLHPGWRFVADESPDVLDTLRLKTFVHSRHSQRQSGDKQNTEEEGVFISEAALRGEREKQQQAQSSRRLLATTNIGAVPVSVPLISIQPRQLQSYLLHFGVNDIASDKSKYDTHRVIVSDAKSEQQRVLQPKPSPITPVRRPDPDPSDFNNDSNGDQPSLSDQPDHLDRQSIGHTGWEYLLILLIGIIVVAFFVTALGLLPQSLLRKIKGPNNSNYKRGNNELLGTSSSPKSSTIALGALERVAYAFDAWSSRVWHRLRAIVLGLRYRATPQRQPMNI